MEGHSGNAKSTTLLNNLRDLWKSPRGTVLRIEFLAGLAITLAFLLAAFGSSRRLSNRWIVQKGFFAAHALSLSLGTYSIGLMQTSPVKSEMFPIWAVCLFTLFGCIDPVTSYNGLDYKGPLSKIVFGICLQCGYVLVMSNSTIFSDTRNTAIIMLAGITFIKSFHRSLALVQQSKMRKVVQDLEGSYGHTASLINYHFKNMAVDFADIGRRYHSSKKSGRRYHSSKKSGRRPLICIKHVQDGLSYDRNGLRYPHQSPVLYHSCFDAGVAFGLSHKLQRHLLGLGCRPWWADRASVRDINYKWALKVIEIELAFLYDIFFTGYPFLHYYQAKTASLWTLASLVGICFVGVATVAPGSRRTTFSPGGGFTSIVDTTTLDLVFTFVILVSIALLQLMQLIQGWTSNWARCAIAWAYGVKGWEEKEFHRKWPFWWPWWMRLKASVATSTIWFDKYLWQEKMGQFSILPRGRLTGGKKKGKGTRRRILCQYILCLCTPLIKLLGFDYVWKVMWDLFGKDTNKRSSVRLDDDVKESIILFLGQIKNDILDGNWLHILPDEHPLIRFYLPYFHDSPVIRGYLIRVRDSQSHGYRYTSCVMMWHTATWYCEQVEQEQEKQPKALTTKADEHISIGGETAAGERGMNINQNKDRNRCMANILSKYCIYLVVSAPELLPGLATETRFINDSFAETVMALQGKFNLKDDDEVHRPRDPAYYRGMEIAKHLLGNDDSELLDDTASCKTWETLALVWVQLLLYAAPYGNMEAHTRHLAQGGEFITHLWALLYHLDIREWKLPEAKVQNITTINHAQRMVTEDDLAVIAFFGSLDPEPQAAFVPADFVTASRLVDGVTFYLTSSPDVAEFLGVPPPYRLTVMNILFWNKAEKKTTFFDRQVYGPCDPYKVALFVYVNKLRVQETASSNLHNPIPIKKQSSDSDDGQSMDEIVEEEMPLPSPS